MQIVIELSDETYKDIKEENGIYGINNGLSARITGKVVGAIQSGVPLPKGHGRLIDADELAECMEIMNTISSESKYAVRMDDIRSADTIIEADKESEEK